MNSQNIAAIVFFITLGALLYWKRKHVEIQKVFGPFLYFAMIKTKLGIRAMDWIARKFRMPLKYGSYLGIVIGFLGMALISFELIRNLIKMIITPDAVSGVGVVQPFVQNVPGTIFVPFFYFIISIFIIAVIHEFSHGVIARVHNIKIKSSGFAFMGVLLPIIPAAFVEPDEKVMAKRPRIQQLSVLAAGPFANIILAFLILGIFAWAGAPLVEKMVDFDGVQIVKFAEGDVPYPAQQAGMELGEVIQEIDGIALSDVANFSKLLKRHKPGDTIQVKTDKQDYMVTLTASPTNKSAAYIGLSAKPKVKVKPEFEQKYGSITASIILWFIGLLYWLFLLNLGIGLFNLAPLGPIDGGRMYKCAMESRFKKKTAHKIWVYTGFIMLGTIILNMGLSIFG